MARIVTEADVTRALASVSHPKLGRSITALGMVRDVDVLHDRARLTIAVPEPDPAVESVLRRDVRSLLEGLGFKHAELTFGPMSGREKDALVERLQKGNAGRQGFEPSRVIAVGSGKGGVGKSSVSVNLAVALAQNGLSVVLIDADVYGFSIPRMLGIETKPVVIEDKIVPPEAYGIAVMSLGIFVEDEQPVIWRGPMLHNTMEQFVHDVFWGAPEIVVIDLPPGTGDVSLTLAELLPISEMIVVTTPQPAAQRVAQRAAFMARELKLHVAGVVENMSWFTGNDGERYELFGSGGGSALARDLGVPLLGRIPLVPALRELGDSGHPIVDAEPRSEVAIAVAGIAETLLAQPRRSRRGPTISRVP
jgi:ATP-binding protein involved in chromosome partitioning